MSQKRLLVILAVVAIPGIIFTLASIALLTGFDITNGFENPWPKDVNQVVNQNKDTLPSWKLGK